MNPTDEDSGSPPPLEEFSTLKEAIQAKIQHYKQVAEELTEDR